MYTIEYSPTYVPIIILYSELPKLRLMLLYLLYNVTDLLTLIEELDGVLILP